MEKLKDFFYDKNDIVVALIIIAAAALIILGRINAIMDYPQVMAAQIEKQQEQSSQPSGEAGQPENSGGSQTGDGGWENGGQDANAPAGGQNGDAAPPADPSKPSTGQNQPASGQSEPSSGQASGSAKPPASTGPNTHAPVSGATVSVVIPSGSSGEKIGQILVDCGLISQKGDFISAASSSGADKKLKAGTFKIPAGSTMEQILAILTN